MNQYKMCMGMWNSSSPLIHINISQVQQRDKNNQSEKNDWGKKTFWESKGGGALKLTEVQPQQVSDPASFQ